MKGWLRPLLFGGGCSFGLLAIGLLISLPEAAYVKDREALVIGVGSALFAALAVWVATRMPKNQPWPQSIVGWVVGFFLIPGKVRGLVGITDLIFRLTLWLNMGSALRGRRVRS